MHTGKQHACNAHRFLKFHSVFIVPHLKFPSCEGKFNVYH